MCAFGDELGKKIGGGWEVRILEVGMTASMYERAQLPHECDPEQRTAQHMQDDCTAFCQLWAATWLDAKLRKVSEAGVYNRVRK
jgi:hypothetical protein